jgi:hypothetical protein
MTIEQSESGSALQTIETPHTARRIPMALVTWVFVVLVLLIVVVLLIVKFTRGSTTVPSPPVTPAPSGVVQSVTSLPAAAFDEAGSPDMTDGSPTVLPRAAPLESDGKPEILFVGAEFCPYCAAERWAVVAALGRFGTFSGLGATTSSKYEVFSPTSTFSFDGAHYHSKYLSFSATEEFGQSPSTKAPAGFPELQKLSAVDQYLIKRFGPELPLVDAGNRVVVSGAAIDFSPGLLTGKSMQQIASELSDPTSVAGRAVLAEANVLTAGICSTSANLPRSVCRSPGVAASMARLGLSR